MKNLIFLILLFCNMAIADNFKQNTFYHVCFTPGGDCTHQIVKQISRSKHSIYVQAYSFTSMRIAKALVHAKKKGIDVSVILDKSQFEPDKYSAAGYLMKNQIPIWMDYKPRIAHNKVMIFDKHIVETGSFNFSNAAQKRNAENLIIIDNKPLAKKYLVNWQNRQIESTKINEIPTNAE